MDSHSVARTTGHTVYAFRQSSSSALGRDRDFPQALITLPMRDELQTSACKRSHLRNKSKNPLLSQIFGRNTIDHVKSSRIKRLQESLSYGLTRKACPHYAFWRLPQPPAQYTSVISYVLDSPEELACLLSCHQNP